MVEFTKDELVNRAHRLVAVMSHPGMADVRGIIEEMCFSAAQTLIKYEGWQPGEIQTLQARAKVAYELRDLLYATIHQQIAMGEQQQQSIYAEQHFAKPEAQKVVDSDDIREKALKLYDQLYPTREEDDGRIPGTYTTLPDG